MNKIRWRIQLFTALFPFGILVLICLLVNNGVLQAQAVQFPTTASSINIGDLDVPGNQLTVEALIYMEKNTSTGDIISKHVNPFNVNYLLRPATFELTTYVNGSSGPTHFQRLVNPVKLSLNKWYHVAATYNGTRMKYYVNGCLVADSAFSGNLFQNNYLAAVGNKTACNCEQFSGKIDELRIWNTARSQREIAASMLYISNPAEKAGLIACYKFDGNYVNSQGNTRWNGSVVGNPGFASSDANMQQSFDVTGIETSNADCNNVNNGGIVIFSNRPDALYSIDGTAWQTSSQFAALKSGKYTVYAKDTAGCLVKNDAEVGSNHMFVTVSDSTSLCKSGSYFGHSSAGTYIDTVPAATGCDTLRTVYISEQLKSIVTDNHSICEGGSYMGHQKAGRYTDTLVAANGCDSIYILQLTVIAPPHPDLGSSRSVCKGDSIKLFPGTYNSYLWQDGSSKDHLTVTKGGFYSVKVANTCGAQQQQVMITDGNCGILFPGAFTPNGDGVNDAFKPVVYNLNNFQWRVYNRVGQVLFETKEYNKGWDGRINGQLQGTGVYVWTCSYTKNNQVEIKKGTLLLIR